MFVKGEKKKKKRCKDTSKEISVIRILSGQKEKMCLNEAENTHYKDRTSLWSEVQQHGAAGWAHTGTDR